MLPLSSNRSSGSQVFKEAESVFQVPQQLPNTWTSEVRAILWSVSQGEKFSFCAQKDCNTFHSLSKHSASKLSFAILSPKSSHFWKNYGFVIYKIVKSGLKTTMFSVLVTMTKEHWVVPVNLEVSLGHVYFPTLLNMIHQTPWLFKQHTPSSSLP